MKRELAKRVRSKSRTGFSPLLLAMSKNRPRWVGPLLSHVPFRLHQHWLVQQFLKEQAGLRTIIRTPLCNGMNVCVPIGDLVGDEIYTLGTLEKDTVTLIQNMLDKETLFFDVGAHVGMYTMLAAPFCREVHCFEPMPWLAEILQVNVRKNRLRNVFLNRKCVRDFTGQTEIWEGPAGNSGNGSCLPIEGFYQHSYPVECTTLDAYCESAKLSPQPGRVVMKIDVERTELEVLKGASGLFRCKPIVVIEFNDWGTDLENVVRFFMERNYFLQGITPSGLTPFSLNEWRVRPKEGKVINVFARPST